MSTDEIMPAGAAALPYRSNIAKLADFAFARIDDTYPERARQAGAHVIVGGQTTGRAPRANTPRSLPATSAYGWSLPSHMPRIHWQNLANFGVLPLEFTDEADHDRVEQGDQLRVDQLRVDQLRVDHLPDALPDTGQIAVRNLTRNIVLTARHRLSARQIAMVLAGGQIPLLKQRSHP